MSAVAIDVEELPERAGEDLGVTPWRVIDQDQIDRFADATGDHQWIHVDPRRAAGGPFGVTIAHGYLTLSLVPVMLKELWEVRGAGLVINYGLERVRFPAPVPAGSRIRARGRLRDVKQIPGGRQSTIELAFELEGSEKPACVAEVVLRHMAAA